MMTRDQLIASLTEITDPDAYMPDDERYFDWSTRAADGRVDFEVGDGESVAQVPMTRDEIAELHRRLTVWLLQHPSA